MLVKKLEMLPVEAIVRGYITGSGWKVYCAYTFCVNIFVDCGLCFCKPDTFTFLFWG